MYHPVHFLKFVLTKFGLRGHHSKAVFLSLLFVLAVMCLVYVYRIWTSPTGLECYELLQEDEEILSVNDYKVLPNSIFFLETSCRHGAGIHITKRQACAFESAAKVHPNSEVLILFPSPISLKNQSALVSELLKYPNIKFLHMDMKLYFWKTPLEEFYEENRIKSSLWPVSHMSDILRALTLWKYGGTYLDSDILMIRPINTMQNFAGAESDTEVAAGFLNFNISNSGRQIIDRVILELRDNFCGDVWSANGPGAISRVLQKTCKEDDVLKMTPEKCNGFTVFPPSAFYPIPWDKWESYFEENANETVIDSLSKSFGLHIWNRLSSGTPVKTNSGSAYTVFASRFCPKIFAIAGEFL